MDVPQYIKAALIVFSLGELIDEPQRIGGGLSNDLWRCRTKKGEYAVKRMVANAEKSDFASNIEAAFKVERSAIEAGVPAPRPILPPGTSRCLAQIDMPNGPELIRVHEWVTADNISALDATPTQLQELGKIIAQIHKLPAPPRNVSVNAHQQYSWHKFESAIASDMEVIQALEQFAEAASVKGQLVWSHRDPDAKNVLIRSDKSPLLIDWDAAGPAVADHDIASVALEWSGIRQNAIDETRLAAVFEGYVGADCAIKTENKEIYAGWIESTLEWLWFNLQRMHGSDGTQAQLGTQEVNETRKILPIVAHWLLGR